MAHTRYRFQKCSASDSGATTACGCIHIGMPAGYALTLGCQCSGCHMPLLRGRFASQARTRARQPHVCHPLLLSLLTLLDSLRESRVCTRRRGWLPCSTHCSRQVCGRHPRKQFSTTDIGSAADGCIRSQRQVAGSPTCGFRQTPGTWRQRWRSSYPRLRAFPSHWGRPRQSKRLMTPTANWRLLLSNRRCRTPHLRRHRPRPKLSNLSTESTQNTKTSWPTPSRAWARTGSLPCSTGT